MIVAHGRNRVIGRDGDMPWRLRDDLRFFKETTTGHVVVMGRKTFQSIGRPLPNRTNIVITRNADFRAEGVVVVSSPEEALTAAVAAASGVSTVAPTSPSDGDSSASTGGDSSAPTGGDLGPRPVFVIGGGQIYRAFLPLAEVVYVTLVDAEPEGDTSFPELDAGWRWTALRRQEADESNDFGFTIYRVERTDAGFASTDGGAEGMDGDAEGMDGDAGGMDGDAEKNATPRKPGRKTPLPSTSGRNIPFPPTSGRKTGRA